MAHGGLSKDAALSAIRNWKKGLYSPAPGVDDVQRLASALGVEAGAISQWRASYRYAPMSARKVRLIAQLIAGRDVQDALDLLTFTHKRAAAAVKKVLQSAVANADEQEADVDNLYVSEARVDQAGRRIGTKAWHPKDRGRAHPIRKEASHIHITVSEG
jgi:large subunit ribosomal protein L22